MEFNRYRMLNERKGVFGLYFSDLLAAATVFVLCNVALEGTVFQFLGFVVPVLLLIGLVPIRKKIRKGVIRAFMKHQLRGRAIYDPKDI